MKIKKLQLEKIFELNIFDADWYKRNYLDVSASGLCPKYHFCKYGVLMGRKPSAELELSDGLIRALGYPSPKENRVLLEAHEIERSGDDEASINYASIYLPKKSHYTINTLRANKELKSKNYKKWLQYLNNYLSSFDTLPISLEGSGSIIHRLRAEPLKKIKNGPLVTIIMPAWNAEKTIEAAANSILNQTWENLELIIIDDYSQDKTWEKLQSIRRSDRRVKLIRNKTNIGPYASKNIAFSISNGEWITGHDSDDWAHPQRIEKHLNAILAQDRPPRASATYMIRLEEDGYMDRFAPISGYSIDGIARLASISCMFAKDFLRVRLGGWDNIKFGADSELIARVKRIIGKEFTVFPQIGMLCLNLESSLTNSSTSGVGRREGLSPVRQEYLKNYTSWHKSIPLHSKTCAKLAFPPASENSRKFNAPKEATIPLFKIRRNFSSLTGKTQKSQQAVTAICVSKRPWYLKRIISMLKNQTHENLHILYIAHGLEHDVNEIKKELSYFSNSSLIEIHDTKKTLGEILNIAIDNCKTDLVAKIDDDDYYGPSYIRSLLAAFHYSGYKNVGIVGKARAFCYVEEKDTLALRFGPERENMLRNRVFGGTIFWSRKMLGDIRFIDSNTGEDTAFFKAAEKKGIKIYSADPYDYIHMRYQAPNSHTWSIDSDEFLSVAKVISKGLRTDLAYST